MPRTKSATISISRPFDARHVAGVGIPGVSNPMDNPVDKPMPTVDIQKRPDIQRSFTSPHINNSITSPTLEPDEAPTHINMSANPPPPKRSNSIANSLRKPSLRLRTSMQRLRGRSKDGSPKRGRETPEPPPSIPAKFDFEASIPAKFDFEKIDDQIMRARSRSPEKLNQLQQLNYKRDSMILRKTIPSIPSIPSFPPLTTTTITSSTSTPINLSNSSTKPKPPTRPKRADSGTAIDFDDLPATERPLGFQEIQIVSSLAERMVLYKKTREYWAGADHGLEEWIWGAGMRRRGVGV